MLTVSEYASNIGKSIDYILELFKKLKINITKKDDSFKHEEISVTVENFAKSFEKSSETIIKLCQEKNIEIKKKEDLLYLKDIITLYDYLISLGLINNGNSQDYSYTTTTKYQESGLQGEYSDYKDGLISINGEYFATAKQKLSYLVNNTLDDLDRVKNKIQNLDISSVADLLSISTSNNFNYSTKLSNISYDIKSVYNRVCGIEDTIKILDPSYEILFTQNDFISTQDIVSSNSDEESINYMTLSEEEIQYYTQAHYEASYDLLDYTSVKMETGENLTFFEINLVTGYIEPYNDSKITENAIVALEEPNLYNLYCNKAKDATDQNKDLINLTILNIENNPYLDEETKKTMIESLTSSHTNIDNFSLNWPKTFAYQYAIKGDTSNTKTNDYAAANAIYYLEHNKNTETDQQYIAILGGVPAIAYSSSLENIDYGNSDKLEQNENKANKYVIKYNDWIKTDYFKNSVYYNENINEIDFDYYWTSKLIENYDVEDIFGENSVGYLNNYFNEGYEDAYKIFSDDVEGNETYKDLLILGYLNSNQTALAEIFKDDVEKSNMLIDDLKEELEKTTEEYNDLSIELAIVNRRIKQNEYETEEEYYELLYKQQNLQAEYNRLSNKIDELEYQLNYPTIEKYIISNYYNQLSSESSKLWKENGEILATLNTTYPAAYDPNSDNDPNDGLDPNKYRELMARYESTAIEASLLDEEAEKYRLAAGDYTFFEKAKMIGFWPATGSVVGTVAGSLVIDGVFNVFEAIEDGIVLTSAYVESLIKPQEKEEIINKAEEHIERDITGEMYSSYVDLLNINEAIAYSWVHDVSSFVGTMAGYAMLGNVGGIGLQALTGALAAAGDSSENILVQGGTWEQALKVGGAAAILGGLSGAGLDILNDGLTGKLTNKSLNQLILNLSKGQALSLGIGMAVFEPIVNSMVEYNTFGNTYVDANGNKIYNNYLDYYLASGGLLNTVIAAGVGTWRVSGSIRKGPTIDNKIELESYKGDNLEGLNLIPEATLDNAFRLEPPKNDITEELDETLKATSTIVATPSAASTIIFEERKFFTDIYGKSYLETTDEIDNWTLFSIAQDLNKTPIENVPEGIFEKISKFNRNQFENLCDLIDNKEFFENEIISKKILEEGLIEYMDDDTKLKMMKSANESTANYVKNNINYFLPIISKLDQNTLNNIITILPSNQRLSIYNKLEILTLKKIDYKNITTEETKVIKALLFDVFNSLSTENKFHFLNSLKIEDQNEFVESMVIKLQDICKWDSVNIFKQINLETREILLSKILSNVEEFTDKEIIELAEWIDRFNISTKIKDLEMEILKRYEQNQNIFSYSSSRNNALSQFSPESIQKIATIATDELLLDLYCNLGNPFLLEAEILKRYRQNPNIFKNNRYTELVFKIMPYDKQQIILDNEYKRFNSNFSNTQLIKNIDLNKTNVTSLLKMNYIHDLGYLTKEKIELLSKLLIKNPYTLEDLHPEILNPNIAKIGDMFIEKMSRYPEIASEIVELYKTYPEKFNIFAEIAKSFEKDNSLNIYNEKIGILIDYFLKCDAIDFTNFNKNMCDDFFEYILGNYYNLNLIINSSINADKILDKLYFPSYDGNYKINYNNFLDSKFENAKTLSDKKNILLHKLFGLSKTEVEQILNCYYEGMLGYVSKDNEIFKYLANLKSIYDVNNIEKIENLYIEMSRTKEDIIYILNEAKKIYTRLYNEKLSITRNKINSVIMSESTKTQSIEDFSLEKLSKMNVEEIDGEVQFKDVATIIEYNGKKIPIVSLTDEFNFMIHCEGAFRQSNFGDYSNMYDAWNFNRSTGNHGICCSYITQSYLGTATGPGNKGLIYGFANISDESISLMGPCDINSAADEIRNIGSRDIKFLAPEDVTGHGDYNEILLERRTGIQPNYLIIFDDFSNEEIKKIMKVSADFDPPLQIVYINRTTVAISESQKIRKLLEIFNEDYSNLNLLCEALKLNVSNIKGNDSRYKWIDTEKYFPTIQIKENIKEYVNALISQFNNNQYDKELGKNIINRLTKLSSSLNIDYFEEQLMIDETIKKIKESGNYGE